MVLPSGTVTFLFTDIEGSTRLLQKLGDRYQAVLMEHNALLRGAFDSNGGHELKTEGDSFFCVFPSAVSGCAAAAAAQRALAQHGWPEGVTVRVRAGLHTGEASLMGNDYIGLDVHRAARIASVTHGGQVLLSDTTRSLVEQSLPRELSLRDLGLHRLKDLARPERLYQLVIEGLPGEFPPLRTLDATPNNLPTQLTSFIGRVEELTDGNRLLQKARLLTLTGPGGTGKTRLSLQIAADQADQFPDGVYFVPLAAVRDSELVPSAMSQALGIPVTGSRLPIDGVIDHLRDKKVLLVLDNLEQLLPAVSAIATQLLQASPGLKVMVSSRSVLHVYGEQEFPVPPLRLPDLKALLTLDALSQYEAVMLFIERALAAKPDFQATNDNAPAIAGICERLDGLPLAIELAAARVKLFSPQALLSRLDHSLSVLGSGARDLPSRQQSLQGAIAWSYDLLDEAGKRLLARFSVFARGGSLEQAEQVCGPASEIGLDVLDGLDQLADHSLLRRLPDFDEPRLLMLQTIREFVAERLQESGEAELIRDRHAAAFRALAEQAGPHLFGDKQKEWLDRLERDHDNFRAALDWWVGRDDAERAMSLGASLWRFWQMRGHLHEGRARMEELLGMPGSRGYPSTRIRALEAAGGIAYWQNDPTAAQLFYDECLELTRASGDPRALANALYNDAFAKLVPRGDAPDMLPLLEEALPLFRQLADKAGVAKVLWGLGVRHYFRRNYGAATASLEEARALSSELGNRFDLAWALHMLALVAIKTGDPGSAKTLAREALKFFNDARDVSGIILVLDDFSAIALLEGNPTRAARLAAASAAHQAASGTGLGAVVAAEDGRTGREGLSEEAAEAAWAEGNAMSVERAVAYALSTAEAVGKEGG